MLVLKTGDPCPCCGRPIKYTDPDALRLLALVCEMMGVKSVRRCGACKLAGDRELSSDPPQVRCLVDGEFHRVDYVCEEFAEGGARDDL